MSRGHMRAPSPRTCKGPWVCTGEQTDQSQEHKAVLFVFSLTSALYTTNKFLKK